MCLGNTEAPLLLKSFGNQRSSRAFRSYLLAAMLAYTPCLVKAQMTLQLKLTIPDFSGQHYRFLSVYLVTSSCSGNSPVCSDLCHALHVNKAAQTWTGRDSYPWKSWLVQAAASLQMGVMTSLRAFFFFPMGQNFDIMTAFLPVSEKPDVPEHGWLLYKHSAFSDKNPLLPPKQNHLAVSPPQARTSYFSNISNLKNSGKLTLAEKGTEKVVFFFF